LNSKIIIILCPFCSRGSKRIIQYFTTRLRTYSYRYCIRSTISWSSTCIKRKCICSFNKINKLTKSLLCLTAPRLTTKRIWHRICPCTRTIYQDGIKIPTNYSRRGVYILVSIVSNLWLLKISILNDRSERSRCSSYKRH
jgi:hypothetical protein